MFLKNKNSKFDNVKRYLSLGKVMFYKMNFTKRFIFHKIHGDFIFTRKIRGGGLLWKINNNFIKISTFRTFTVSDNLFTPKSHMSESTTPQSDILGIFNEF